jgi:two-component system cell cycle response regulator
VTTAGQYARRLLFAAAAVALGAQILHGAIGFGGARADVAFDQLDYVALELVGALACIVRVARVREQRLAWASIAASLVCWTAGDVAWMTLDLGATYPSIADALYLAFYPLFCAGMALLLSGGRDRVAARLWADGLIAGLAFAACAVAVVFEPIVRSTHGTPTQTAVNLAYPLADIVLIGFVLTAFATQAWRPGRGWALLGLGAVMTAIADGAYVYQDALGTYDQSSIVSSLWPAALLCCGWAAWQPWRAVSGEHRLGRQTFALPAAFALLALGLLAYGQFVAISHSAALLATTALIVATIRGGWTFRDNIRLLRATREEALTDGLTGLPNRRRLTIHLDRAVAEGAGGRPAMFAFFDLDGFKSYNDGFGHAAGDMLLGRLATRLAAAVADRGRAYRLGGDEFCVLLDGRLPPDDPLIDACVRALSEQGEGFRVGVSHGVVTIPDEADSTTHALQLADQRMYAAKDETRASSRRQACDVLLQVLREREPDLHEHLSGVTALAVAVGRRLTLTAEQLDEVTRAAQLHDIGKIAVPDEILHKPGPLTVEEWELMRQHTVIGDRILAAAPAMRPVGAIVRSSHERFDGDGYPDRLAGERIPLGSRIIAVCDAFHAMTSVRAYKPALSRNAALEELQRCAGSQFDPVVVEAFCELVRPPGHEQSASAPALPL